jgi:hypothetical protein
MRTVSALYIDPRGPYPKLEGVDAWPKERDALLYDGPHAVVAHPPCAPWSKMRWLASRESHARERMCALRAVKQVRKFGGVLEHPEHSNLWSVAALPWPIDSDIGGADIYDGRSYFVRQVSWGHACAKPTWIYVVGVDPEFVKAGLRLGGTPTHCVTRGPGQSPGLKVAHASMRSRSPLAFAQWLVSLARVSRV